MKRLAVVGSVVLVLAFGVVSGPVSASAAAGTPRTLRFTGELGADWGATAGGGLTNWVTGDGSHAFPADGDRLVLPDDSAQTAPVDDIAGLRVDGLIVEGDYSELSGVPLRIGRTGLVVDGGGPVAVTNGLILTADSQIAAPGANLSLGTIDLHGHLLTFGSSADTTGYLEVGAPITGAGAIRKIGAGTVLLEGDSDYHGPTTVTDGVVSVSTSQAFGADDTNVVTVGPGGEVQAADDPFFPGPFVLAGGDILGACGFWSVSVTAPSRIAMIAQSAGTQGEIHRLDGTGDLEIDGKNLELFLDSAADHTGRLTLVGPKRVTGFEDLHVTAGAIGSAIDLRGFVKLDAQGSVAGALRQFGMSSVAPFEVVDTQRYQLGRHATLVVSPGFLPTTIRTRHGVQLAGALSVPALELPPPGQSLTLIDNAGRQPVDGAFAGLPEGSDIDGTVLSYVGGDGNDVTLTTPG